MKSIPIDLRSDTVTRPTAAMREAMMSAEVGDDVFGEDPTVNLLQQTLARLLGKEDALLTPTGVMANQIAIKCHTQPGDEVIVEREAHILNYETAAPSMISGVQLLPIPGVQGVITAEQIELVRRPPAYYLPKTALICLENTHNRAGGTIYPLEMIKKIRAFSVREDIPMHLDGARIWNAWMATGIHPREYARQFDSIAVCFSKGLGAPAGSAVAGSREFIARARKVRKIVGGGMRQAGILAAAALYALEHNVKRLKEDHEKAKVFAEGLSEIPGCSIDGTSVQTNIIIMEISGLRQKPAVLLQRFRKLGVLLTDAGSSCLRAVTHMDVSLEQVREAVHIIRKECNE